MIRKKIGVILFVLVIITLLVTPLLADEIKMDVTYKLPSGVEVSAFGSEFSTHGKLSPDKPCLYLNLTLKNASQEAGRYQVYIILPAENKSAGGVMPRNGEPLGSGAEVSEKYPFQIYEVPSKVTVMVEKIKS